MTGEIRECQSLSKRLNELIYSLEIAASSLGKMHFRRNPGKINFCPPNPPVWILGGACDFIAFKQNSHKKQKLENVRIFRIFQPFHCAALRKQACCRMLCSS